MSTATLPRTAPSPRFIGDDVYPSSDGEPMAENGLHLRWIVTLHGNIDVLFKDDPNVVCQADNLIYPVQYSPEICVAPDVYVAFGPPKYQRESYMVWEEGGVFPQVIFEILSPGNRQTAMNQKLHFYDKYGAEEYYIYEPHDNLLEGFLRDKTTDRLVEHPRMHQFVSPRLKIRFDLSGEEMIVYHPDGQRFLTFQEQMDAYLEAQQRLNVAKEQAVDAQRQAAESRKQLTDSQQQTLLAEQTAERLAAKLRALGIDPYVIGE